MELSTLPLILAYIGIGLVIGLSGTGSAMGTAAGAMAAVGALRKRPEAFGTFVILSALPGTQGLYGFAGFYVMQSMITPELTILQGSAILGGGLALGIAGLFSGLHQGKVCANGIDSIGSGNDVFGKTMILAVFPELYAIIAFAALFLIVGSV